MFDHLRPLTPTSSNESNASSSSSIEPSLGKRERPRLSSFLIRSNLSATERPLPVNANADGPADPDADESSNRCAKSRLRVLLDLIWSEANDERKRQRSELDGGP